MGNQQHVASRESFWERYPYLTGKCDFYSVARVFRYSDTGSGFDAAHHKCNEVASITYCADRLKESMEDEERRRTIWQQCQVHAKPKDAHYGETTMRDALSEIYKASPLTGVPRSQEQTPHTLKFPRLRTALRSNPATHVQFGETLTPLAYAQMQQALEQFPKVSMDKLRLEDLTEKETSNKGLSEMHWHPPRRRKQNLVHLAKRQ